MNGHKWCNGNVDVWIQGGWVLIEGHDLNLIDMHADDFAWLVSIAPQVLAAARDEPAPMSVNPSFGPINADEVLRKGGGE
jgi:hypothetical protein